MAQDCFLTFGICRQMIMMQPGKLSILPLESKQWGRVSGVPNDRFAWDGSHGSTG